VRSATLTAVLRWLVVVLILRVLIGTVSNYPDYFPPNFDSLFLEGREATFTETYQVAFYVHIFSGPVVLLNGLILLSDRFRRRYGRWHRVLGRTQVIVLLLLVLPTSVVMARNAFGGWPAGVSFVVLSVVTGACAILGVIYAKRRRFDLHRRWMLRTFVLLCSTVVLRLMLGAASLVGVSSPEAASVFAAWCSWLIPLAALEVVLRWRTRAASRPSSHTVLAPVGMNRTQFGNLRISATKVEQSNVLRMSDDIR
jgi:uncharacterized membrane protein